MTVLGIGVDIVHVPRIAAILKGRHGTRFVQRILSSSEKAQWQTLVSSGAPTDERFRFLAVRWSVKEAAYKAVYPSIKPSWKDFTYTSFSGGVKPQLCYHLPHKFDSIHVSVSHDGEYVVSQVLVEGRLPGTKSPSAEL